MRSIFVSFSDYFYKHLQVALVRIISDLDKGLSGEVKVFAFGKGASVIDLHHYGFAIDRVRYSKGGAKGIGAVSGSKFVIAKDFPTGSFTAVELVMVIGGHAIGFAYCSGSGGFPLGSTMRLLALLYRFGSMTADKEKQEKKEEETHKIIING